MSCRIGFERLISTTAPAPRALVSVRQAALIVTPEYEGVLRCAARLARVRGEGAVSATHLLLAVMAAADTPWPLLIVERGGLCFRRSLQRLRWEQVNQLETAADNRTPPYRSPMRMMVLVVLALLITLVFRGRGVSATASPLTWDTNATEALVLARRLAGENSGSGGSRTVGVGHLLLALASTPGGHLRLIDGGTVIACAVRRKLGLAAWHHRLVLACDLGKLPIRRWGMKLDRRVRAHGRLSMWGMTWAVNGLVGLLVTVALFPITVLTNLLLYIFLWPAALLMAGLRSICGVALGYRTTNHRWHEIPGGEMGLAGAEGRISDRRVAVLILLPRLLAFVISIAALVVIIWRGQRLGIFAFPTLFARPDIVSGNGPDALWLTPFLLFSDMLQQNGPLGGIGLLAGAGLGFMSMPTYRELTLIRLYAGHEVGFGSRLARIITFPASLLTGAIACIDTVLPFRNGPIYLTVYLVPMIFSMILAMLISGLLP